jgi:hypothetical protein
MVAQLYEFDPLGLSTFLNMRWPMADRTLIQGVTVLPGGQQWRFSPYDGFNKRTYYRYQQLAKIKKETGPVALKQVVSDMGTHLRPLEAQTSSLHIPVTAGRETRLIVALSLKERLTAEYFHSRDAPEIFKVTEKLRRWGGNQSSFTQPAHKFLAFATPAS